MGRAVSASTQLPTLVVGEGIAGQTTALELARLGVPVLLLARAPAEHAESSARHDGVDAALGEDDDPARHLEDLLDITGAESRPFLESMTSDAPELVSWLLSLDVPFERTRQDELAFEQLAGSSRARSLHAGCLTARHVSRRLSQLLLGYEARGKFERHTACGVVDLLLDAEGRAVGVLVRSFATGEVSALRAHGVCVCSGGHAGLFVADTLSPPSLGAVTGVALGHGARLLSPERVSWHPHAYRAGGLVRKLPRRLESLGAKVDAGLLDLTAIDRAPLRIAAGPALESYSRVTGSDAYSEPIVVSRTPDRTLGGLFIGHDTDPESPLCHNTTIPGLYAAGGVTGAYFGQATTPGTPLLAALHGGKRAARAVARFRDKTAAATGDTERLARDAEKQALLRTERLLERKSKSGDTPAKVAHELRQAMAQHLAATLATAELRHKLDELEGRLEEVGLGDDAYVANQALAAFDELSPALALARAIAVVIEADTSNDAVAGAAASEPAPEAP